MPGNNPIQRFMARQLRMPSGWFGAAVVSEIMNRVNKGIINSTIELLQIEPHQQVLEIGFGGGTALSQIAARLQTGAIGGVDISLDLVHKAERKFREENCRRPRARSFRWRFAAPVFRPHIRPGLHHQHHL